MQATIRARSIVFTLCRTARIADTQYTRSVHLLVRRRSRCHISDFVRTETMNELQSIARLKIHPGKLEEFKRLAAKCMESVRTRDNTLQYDCSSATIPNAWYTRDIVTPRPFLSTSRISGKRWPRLLRPALALARSAELPARS